MFPKVQTNQKVYVERQSSYLSLDLLGFQIGRSNGSLGGGKPRSAEILALLYSQDTCNIAKGISFTDIWKHIPKIRKASKN